MRIETAQPGSAALEAAFPEPRSPGASRTALAVLQAQALWEARSSQGPDSIPVGLYVAAAQQGRAHLAAAARDAGYRAGVDAGTLPGRERILSVVRRKRWAEQKAVLAIRAGVRQVVVLGAGFDPLGVRLLRRDPALIVIDFDRVTMIDAKQRALADAAIARPWPRFAAGDLADAAALGDTLSGHGWQASAPTFFLAEAVLEYLASDETCAVLAEVARLAADGSRFACTVRHGGSDVDHLAAATAAAGEPMRFRPTWDALPDLLTGAGFEVLEGLERPPGRSGAAAFLLLAPVKER